MTDVVRLHYSNPGVVADPFAAYEAVHAKASVVVTTSRGTTTTFPGTRSPSLRPTVNS
jgi:hypothetical protein